MTLLSLIVFFLLLGLVVVVHEGGHLLACLALRIRMLEIGIGLPPRLLRIGRRGETEFTWNALPLGAFVRPAGDFDPGVPRGLAACPPAGRMLVYVSGAAANVVLALALLTLGFRSGWPDQVRVTGTAPGSPAEAAGLRAGDVIVSVDGQPVHDTGSLSTHIDAARGESIVIRIQRAGQEVEIAVGARQAPPAGEGPAGFTSQGVLVRYPWGMALRRAIEMVRDLAGATLQAIGSLAGIGRAPGSGVRLVGPLGMKQISDRTLANALEWGEGFPMIYLAAWLSTSLGLFNLMPFPALDGGRAAFLGIEIACGRRVPARIEARVHAAGMVIVLAAMLALVAKDLVAPVL